jgi:hypothetical protein
MRLRNRGFTFSEFQVAIAIALLTLTAAASLYIFYWRTFVIGNNILDVYTNSRVAVEWIAMDIRRSAQVVSNHGSYTTTDHSIVLQSPSIDTYGNVISSKYDHITYQLQGSDLYRIVEKDASSARANGNRAIAHYCTSLNFSSGGTPLSEIANLSTVNTVGIYLPLNKLTLSLGGGGTETASITPTTVVKIRNK